MITKRKYNKNTELCKVTFKVPKEASLGARSISIVGDFNDWNIKDNPMKKKRNGEFILEVDLKVDHEYQFRYLLDEEIWENDWHADKYIRSDYGNCDNSVIIV